MKEDLLQKGKKVLFLPIKGNRDRRNGRFHRSLVTSGKPKRTFDQRLMGEKKRTVERKGGRKSSAVRSKKAKTAILKKGKSSNGRGGKINTHGEKRNSVFRDPEKG